MSVVKINAISVPAEAAEELERRFASRHGAVDSAPGFLSFKLLRPVSGGDRYFVMTEWESDEAFQAWRSGPMMEAHRGPGGEAGERAKPVSTGAELLEFEVVQSSTKA